MCNEIKIFTIINLIFLFVNIHAQNKVFIPGVSVNDKSVLNQNINNDDLFVVDSINELHMLPDSGRSGYPVYLTFTINNTDQFVAFQFDVILPPVMTYVQDSVWLFRKTNHIILANMVNPQTLRILAYSPSNQPFNGNYGEIVRIMFNLNGSAGSYNVGLSNVTISNAIGVNILTGYFSSFVKITAPDIAGQTNIDLGEISVLNTISYNYQLSNTGDDTLFVTDFLSSEIYFWNDTPIPQTIPPGESKVFNLKFHNINKGQYLATYTIRSNDPDEDPFYIDAIASSFAPNYILIQNAEAFVYDTVTLKIDVNNYEQFINFQVDLDFPDSLTYITNSAVLTNRKQDHVLFETQLTPNKIRLFTYSLNQLPFIGDSGTVATLNFVVGDDTGTFPLQLSGGILTDSTSQNIIKSTINGEINVQYRPMFQLAVTIADDWNMVSVPGINPNGQGVDTWWSGRDPIANVYKYQNGYQIVTTATPGEGYWMKHIGTNIYNTGDEWPADGIEVAPHDPINVLADWNMIGGYEDTVLTAALTTTPPGLITGAVYGYSGGYNIVTNLLPGYAYWIKLTGPGQINFPTTMSKLNGHVLKYFKDDWGRIIITDATGRVSTLYAINGEVNLNNYELPPAPPANMFDIRYGSGRIAEDINSGIQSIQMRGLEYPITVKVEGMNLRIQDESGKEINENVKSGEMITISNQQINKLIVTDELIPEIYSLAQNYPNPFNPSTLIEFTLPEYVANVSLTIYDILGQRVTQLVNSPLKAGRYQYKWNAGFAATGMYIYELRTDKFISLKKMILMK